ncbi:MAG: TetR/AcrR family transcriptional regulator [Bacteroidota bacterium]
MKESEKSWIITGHQIFAEKGPSALTVEGLARAVKKSKSSFYHHFADLQVFTSRLLDYHLSRAQIILEEERKCQNIDPDLFDIFIKYKLDVLFHRQLLVNRNISEFESLYLKITDQGIAAILNLWNKELNLTAHSSTGRRLLTMGIENLFQRSSLEKLNLSYLNASFTELKTIASALRSAHTIDGSV